MTSNTIAEDLPDERPDDQLAFSRIKSEIETQAKTKAENQLKFVEKEIEEIISAARDKGEKIKLEIIGKATNEALNNKIRELSRKRLSLNMDYLEAREQILYEILIEVKSKLQKFTQSSDYSTFLSNLVKQSGFSIGGGKLVLFLRSEDKSLFTKASLTLLAHEISTKTNEKTTLVVANDDLKTLGGIKLVREDNRLYIDNTLETRLERDKEPIRVALLELLS